MQFKCANLQQLRVIIIQAFEDNFIQFSEQTALISGLLDCWVML